MKEKIKNNIDNVFMMLLIFILIASSVLIRKGQYFYIIQIAIISISALYIVLRNILKEPIKILKNKLDILILALIGSSFIPLIFGTYASLSATVIIGLNYICLYFLYVLVSEICSRKNIKIEYINILIIIQAVIFVIVGIENLTTNKILPFIWIDNITNGESRLVSLFGNPNVFASYLVFTFFIILNKTIHSTIVREKIILNILNTIIFIGIILTYSKAIFVIAPLMLIIYMFIIKNKEKNVEIIQNLITYFCLAILYVVIFNKLLLVENYIAIWGFLILIIMLEILINLLNMKIKNNIEKVKIRYIIMVILVLIVCSIVFLVIEIKNVVPYNIFNNNNTISYAAKKIYNIQGNTQYKILLDIEADVYSEEKYIVEDMYEINIIERDERNKEIKNTSIMFGKYKGIKEIDVLTHENTKEFKIEFKAKYQYIARNLIVKELKINDEVIPLQYKNLPIKLIDKIKDININYKTAQERIQFIKDALKLSKENLLTGIGGEGWQYRYGEVQGYDYTSLDIHSYPTQVLLEFGLFGFIALMAIYIYIIRMKTDSKYLGVKLALIVIMVHSAIDSEMKIFYMQILVFIYFAIFSSLKVEYKIQREKVAMFSNICYTIVAILTIYLILNRSIYTLTERVGKFENNKIGLKVSSAEYKENNKKIAEIYDKVIKYERNRELNYYTKFLTSYIQSGQTDKIEEYYIKIKEYKNKWKQKPSKIIEKSSAISTIIKILEGQNNIKLNEWIVKFAEIEINENENVRKELETLLEEQYTLKEESMEYGIFIMNHEEIQAFYERYVLGIEVINKSNQNITKDLLDGDIKIENKNILLYHTHGTEAYNAPGEYDEIEYAKTLNEKYNVISVGDTLKRNLEESGLKIIHLKDYNDLQGVSGAYDRSEIKVKEQLNLENIQIIFDIHRDANLVPDVNQKDVVVINGQEVATLRFVIASGHEGWKDNLKWAVMIQKKADEKYPGLFKPMLIYDNNYNQNLSKYATLIEVGKDSNTIEEAQISMKYFSNALSEILNQF